MSFCLYVASFPGRSHLQFLIANWRWERPGNEASLYDCRLRIASFPGRSRLQFGWNGLGTRLDCGVVSRWLFKRRARHMESVREQELQVSSLFCVTCPQPAPFPYDCLLVTIDVSAFYLNIPQDTMALETPQRDTVKEQELKCRRHGLRDPAQVSYGYECSHRHPARAGTAS